MGATGSRLVSGGMKPPASTFPAAPFSFDTHAARMSGHAYAGCAPVLWAGASTQVEGVRRPVEVWGCIPAGLPQDAAADPTGQPSGFPDGPNISGQYRYTSGFRSVLTC